ncbi:fibronectin type III domain-containing protein [Flavobacterium sp. '19STA2R22 D10 B1']|uniref:fibronectin type III domain-containing protein n=1 Tax=Flavobacterium aerium TaxID=3037261 RepID=UPI00278C803E|nr:fibronectin type III domain-containing protein [Flavobacterium sp. '19STA2R22 D10 B1']
MKKQYHLLWLLLLSVMSHAQDLHPYLQTVTPTSIYVNWKTDSNPESIVEYGTSASNLAVTVTGNTNVFTDSGYPGNYFYHSVKLINLTPNTKYYYKIKTGTNQSTVYSFKTLPLPGQAATSDGHIRFLIMGDNQLKAVPRYDSLVSAAKRKVQEKWGATLSPEDNIAMTFMVGDQVDVGTLDHYEHVHFKKNIKLSGNIPIQTTVGNHETYGTLGMQSYYDHFYIDEISYKGISSGTENYYAQQAGNVLFISLSSEHTGAAQSSWLQQVVTAANNDPTVEWIFSLSHRPYQAEQYVGDISTWVRNTAVPLLATSSKYAMHIGAHHHLYHRGQLKNTPNYNIISGGTAWDQYWGMSSEQDFDDVQKTICNWIYQIVDIDVVNKKMDIESYSIGSVDKWKNNQLMDSFHRYKDKAAPQKPEIQNTFAATETLPLTINGSVFTTTTGELLNTTQFLLSKTANFDIITKEVYRDYENLYGKYGTQKDSTVDRNLGVDITKIILAVDAIPNGDYFIKARYRDRNLEWSPWSDVKTFKIIGSNNVNTEIITDALTYAQNAPIKVNYTDAPASATTWVGLYKEGQTPGSATPSLTWQYTTGSTSGIITFANGLANKGRYFAAIFSNGGYTEIAPRKFFYVGPLPILSTNQEEYAVGSPVVVSFNNGPQMVKDWIGIYKMGHEPGQIGSTAYEYVTTTAGSATFNSLPVGYYYAEYFLQDGYNAIGNKVFFKIGNIVTSVWINKPIYDLGEQIVASWTDAPGIVKDWLGIYQAGHNPNIDPLLSYTYFNGQAEGTSTLTGDALPTQVGNYFLVMFTNDSYNEVSNRVSFEVIDSSLGKDDFKIDNGLKVYPNPTNNNKQTFIQSDYPIDEIEIFNMEGKLMYATKNVNNNKYSLITQDLPTGTYILKIHSRKLFTAKLIVK